jgi:ABC-type uncharacterized transport system substrate-binding protein
MITILSTVVSILGFRLRGRASLRGTCDGAAPPIDRFLKLAKAGGLMAYGVDFVEMWRHAAEFVDKILKGARPETLPVEPPTKFDLPPDLKIAKAFGLMLPISLVYRANHVIE